MVEKTNKVATRPQPVTNTSNPEKRKLELIQLETRYKSTYRLVSDNDRETIIRLSIKPSDPDFPYELDSLKLQLYIPIEYPKSPCSVQVLNSDIPKGFAFNLEKGFASHVDPSNSKIHQTLVRQMNWLDRNMETLLQQAPAPTVRFVSNSSRASSANKKNDDVHANTTAVSETQQSQPANVTAAKSQNSESSSSKSLKDLHVSNHDTAVDLSKPIIVQAKKIESSEKKEVIPQHKYSKEEIANADKRRKQEYRQLETRFCDSFKTIRTNSKETLITLILIINDPEFTQEHLIGGKELHIKYHIPILYPLEPCYVDIENKQLDKTRANWVSLGFSEHVTNGDYTLFENLNWLNRNLELLLSSPPLQKTEEQIEAETISSEQQKHLKPPSKKDILTKSSSQEHIISQQKPFEAKKISSLFEEDTSFKNNRVIIVNDPSLAYGQADEEDVEVELAEGDEDISPFVDHQNDTESEDEKTKTLVGLSQPVVRRGTEIRLIDPKLENISLFRCALLHMMVKCARCKETVEVENIKPEENERVSSSSSSSSNTSASKTERWMPCPTCSSILGIKFHGELVHQGALSIGLVQLAGCTAYDILPSAYIGTCGSCMADMSTAIRLSPHDPPRTIRCFSCHAKMTCSLGDYRFIKIGSEGGERLKASEQQVMKLKKKKKSREEHLTIGESLPDQGTCPHYRKSKRWFRFSCCNKLYPCDICHDSKEDHISDMAKRHVCGLCSREQNIVSGKPCICGHEFEKAPQKGAFWEGGKGVRNKVTMSRKDPHKHKGLGKTVSKKQERVGIAGKKQRQQKTESSTTTTTE
ncbi:uncharacterized protein BX663DRAFT_513864 [Cokeromyces recurvatus]|uniref:uncharacterized protein n=1 Tax=Cokeromyces recurvatus TaxID=90255 RepID=UPI00221F13E2|nr:uncharacterized protein BX663DRAFT_513864 [Cokeromyces recurvatus]KAI7901731.1 hypothetical protein BX663DRAFT_513864 [Cokeromyces recurvatus]